MKCFDFRLTPVDQQWQQWDQDKIKRVFKSWCKKWAFQIECGKVTGKFHIQARLSCKEGNTTEKAMLSKLSMLISPGDSVYLKPTASQNMGNMFYVVKVDTRVAGPFTDKDRAGYVQKRFRDPVLRPWQQSLLERIEKSQGNDREILMVVDKGGNVGKSFFKGYMESKGAVIIPSTMKDGNDMVRCLMAQVVEGDERVHTVLLDVPRATSQGHWWGLARGLETMKSGFLHDERYNYKKCVIEPPVIVCFMNDTPPEGCMSKDIFKFLEFNFKGKKVDATADASAP